MRVTKDDLRALNERFVGASALEVLRFAHATFGPRAAILSSMQRGGTYQCHVADKAGLSFDVLFVDTGLLHQETRWTRDEVSKAHRHLNVVTIEPPRTFGDQTGEEGLLYMTREGQERCCHLRKAEPLLQIKGRYDAILGGLRRDEGGARANTQTFALDARLGTLRVHPLAYVKREEIGAYVKEHADVVVNPLHAMGFPTIGCYTCTTPTLPDEPLRAGRWRHLANVEYCGINPSDIAAPDTAIDIDDRYRGLFT